jgi:hypothetical protein
MKIPTLSKKMVAASTLVGALAASAAGYAAAGGWTSPQGSGSGSATSWTAVASVPSNSTTAPGGTLATALYPGGSGVTGVVSITNPNPYPVVVTAIDNNGGSAAIGSCIAGTVSATNNDGSAAAPLKQTDGTTTSIAAGASGLYNVVYTMASTADNSCQTQTFTVGLHVGAASASF